MRTAPEIAAHLAVALRGSWPSERIPESTVELWARVLAGAEEDVAEETVERVSRYERPPTRRELERVLSEIDDEFRPKLERTDDPDISGRKITAEEWRHGHYHLTRYFATGSSKEVRDPDEMELAVKPWECPCEDWKTWKPTGESERVLGL